MLDNITNWRVIADDDQIINFITMEDTFKDSTIDEYQHDVKIELDYVEHKNPKENSIPRFLVKLERFYDLQEKFKRVTNYKTHSFSMRYEVVNLGTDTKPQNINLWVQCMPNEKTVLINLFKEFKDIFHDHMKI